MHLAFCLRCGNLANQNCVYDFWEDVKEEASEKRRYLLLQCSTCQLHGLYAAVRDLSLEWPFREALSPQTPEVIRHRFRRMLRVRYQDPDYFAVEARKTLEDICSNKLLSGSDLARKLEHLRPDSSIFDVFQEMNSKARKIGNKGAHAGASVTPEEAAHLELFLRTTIDLIYETPIKADQIKRAIDSI